MKKITFFLTTAFFAISGITQVRADSYQYAPYIGLDYTYDHASARGFNPYHNALGFHIGSDYSRYFGTELFFNQSNGHKSHKENFRIKTSYRSYGLDLMAYLPVGCSKQFSLLGTTGIGEYVYKTTVIPAKHHNKHGYGYRFGGGFKYALNKNWSLRMIARYVNFDKFTMYKHAAEYSAGIEYHF